MPTALTVQTDMSSFTFEVPDQTGNTFDNSTGNVYLHVQNIFQTSTSLNMTIYEQRTCNFGHAQTNMAIIVGAGHNKIHGPFDILRFNDSSRIVTVTYTGWSDALRVAAVRG